MNLPYYPMYPSDCDGDENVRLMEDEELGLYFRCLNHSWMNDGLPNSDEDVRRIMKDSSEAFARKWPRVSTCFPVAEDGRRRNKRQEKERAEAHKKSAKARESANRRWHEPTSRESDANASTQHCESNARASASGSESEFVVGSEEEKQNTSFRENALTIVPPPHTALELIEHTAAMYAAGGVAVPEEHKRLAVQTILHEPYEVQTLLPQHVAWSFQTGRWPNPSKTKSLLNVLRDGDWKVKHTERIIPQPREPSKFDPRESVTAAFHEQMRKQGRI